MSDFVVMIRVTVKADRLKEIYDDEIGQDGPPSFEEFCETAMEQEPLDMLHRLKSKGHTNAEIVSVEPL